MTARPLLQRLLISTLAVTLLSVGCTRTEAPPAPVEHTATIVDNRLDTYVQARFQDDPLMRTHDIDVTTNDGVVTLRGTVPTAEARAQAATLAQQVDGVRSVDNQLEVREAADGDAARASTEEVGGRSTSPRADQRSPGWITTKIQAQYFVNPEIKPWNIDVTTNSAGVVTLRGEVEEAADRDEAVRIAQGTQGVTRVDNQLRVEGDTAAPSAMTQPEESGDAWVTAKVQAKFFIDPDVKGRNIDVDTTSGVVTLRGEVETDAERRQAIALARSTDGVASVNDQLQVRRNHADTTTRGVAVTVDDAWITTKIQSMYFLDQLVKGRDIGVDTRQGVVTLKGTVDSKAEREAAVAIAQDTDGVARVVDQLTIAATQRRDQ
jgi:osmotically-inducible protein OsmY